MNIVTLVGRLTKDIDLRFAAGSGVAVANFTLAVNRMKKEDGADFITCKAFGKTAEILSEYVFKGHQLAIVGRMQTGSYENKEGKKVYTTDVIVDKFDFIQGKEKTTKNNNINDLEDVTLDDGDIPF